jgi:Tfp pilus assembly protein FimT
MLVVIFLIGIMAAVAVPGIHRIRLEWELWGGAHLLENSLFWARTHAITSNDSLILCVEEEGRVFYWTDPDGSRFDLSLRRLPPGVRIVQSPSRQLRFYQHGNAAPAGSFVIQGNAGSYRVVVSILGRIRLQRE